MHRRMIGPPDPRSPIGARSVRRRVRATTFGAFLGSAVLSFAVVVTACSPDGPTRPAMNVPVVKDSVARDTTPVSTDTVTVPIRGYPPLARSASLYNRVTPSAFPGVSRFVLYGDSTFALQYNRPDFGFFEYKGAYWRADSTIVFTFSASGGDWYAHAVVRGESLILTFNALMRLSDFEDGEYRYAGESSGRPSIHVVTFTGGSGPTVVRLADGTNPAWSPDGRSIAFQRDGRIHVIDADGRNERALVDGISPAWSPDGARIAFGNRNGIAVMNADGTGVTTLIPHDFRTDMRTAYEIAIGDPTWSPSGLYIAFECYGEFDAEGGRIHVMNADGSNVRPAVPAENRITTESDPSWSPDGSRLIYHSTIHGIASVALSGGGPRSISTGFDAAAFASNPIWSPSGSHIAFTYHVSAVPAIWIMPAAGGAGHELISHATEPAYSPDGSRMAFVTSWGW